FFLSSRGRHTRFSRDWSSDVCSSDLVPTKRLMKDCALFEEQRAHIKSEYAKFIEEVSEKPFLASFLVWVKEVAYREGEAIEGAKIGRASCRDSVGAAVVAAAGVVKRA